MKQETLLIVAGILHFGILIASASVPKVLNWHDQLGLLSRFMRRLVWVYGVFIVFVIIGFGLISIVCADALISASPLAQAICCFIGLFWLLRHAVQFFVFDLKDIEAVQKNVLLRLGYHSLTIIFSYFVVLYFGIAWIGG